jgi:putative tricarboxylic transport membrane protein
MSILVVLLFCLAGAVAFTIIGLISGTDETASIAPFTLLVVLLGAPPAAVFGFFMAAVIAKHISHAVPTALLGIPGDTMAFPLMRDANLMRYLGVPHIALRKMVSAAVISVIIAIPVSMLFAVLLSSVGEAISAAAPWIFLVATLLIAYFSPGRWASVLLVAPFVFFMFSMQALTADFGIKLVVCFFIGIAAGPLVSDLFRALSPPTRASMLRPGYRRVAMAPDTKDWGGFFPNPFKVLDNSQVKRTAAFAGITSTTFVFSPIALTVIIGEYVAARTKHAYHRLTSVLSTRNGVTESTYIAEIMIPIVAFGIPLSPIAVGVGAPLFNAPPRFTVGDENVPMNNLHTLMTSWEFLLVASLAAVVAILIAYPFAMNAAHRAASAVMRNVSHEAIIATFIGLIVVIGLWEGGLIGILVILTTAIVAGFLSRTTGFGVGPQFMSYYVSVLTVPPLLAMMT